MLIRFISFLIVINSDCFADDSSAIIENIFNKINGIVASILFHEVDFLWGIPFILVVMVFGGLFFTVRYGFVNLKLFKHAFDVIRGRYDNPDDQGEISHFQALTSALSATVGLGNIAGVAVAVQLGGPGAVFWLWVVAFFGMSMKFSSCTFAQLYREVDKKGHVLGGPMVYLTKAFAGGKLAHLGRGMGIFYAVMTIFASFGGGNMFQGNQTFELLSQQFPIIASTTGADWIVGVTLALFAALVLLGGIKRIGAVTSKMVPAMCGFYVLTCLIIIISNISLVPSLFVDIFTQAFNPDAIYAGGFIGVLIQGVKRASFSNEAGIGSAAIAHAAAKTDEPVREGVVAMIEPFIDTHIVCTMTSLAILITGSHLNTELAGKGAQVTANAFATLGGGWPIALTIATVIFAFSTVVSWSYYGERATEYLFGKKSIIYYKIVYIFVIVLGPVLSLGAVIDFSDLMLLSMAFPNIIGMMILSGEVKSHLNHYMNKLKSGKMKTY